MTFNDHQHVLSNFGDTFYLVRKFVIYYVPNSIKVRFKNKNTCDICKISKQRKVTNTPPIFSNYLNQESHFEINLYFKFLFEQSTHKSSLIRISLLYGHISITIFYHQIETNFLFPSFCDTGYLRVTLFQLILVKLIIDSYKFYSKPESIYKL